MIKFKKVNTDFYINLFKEYFNNEKDIFCQYNVQFLLNDEESPLHSHKKVISWNKLVDKNQEKLKKEIDDILKNSKVKCLVIYTEEWLKWYNNYHEKFKNITDNETQIQIENEEKKLFNEWL